MPFFGTLYPSALAIAAAAAVAAGAFHGLLMAYLKLNALIVTLAMFSFLQGLMLFNSGGSNVNIADAQTT